MISKNGTRFLTQLILNNYEPDKQIQRLVYSERVTVALDLQRLAKLLVKEIEEKTGKDIFAAMF